MIKMDVIPEIRRLHLIEKVILDNIPPVSDNEPSLDVEALVRLDDEGHPKRLSESEGAVLVAVALRGYAAFDPELSV